MEGRYKINDFGAFIIYNFNQINKTKNLWTEFKFYGLMMKLIY
jgi:hypothetical protein